MKALSIYRPRVIENALSEFDRYMDSFFGDNFLASAGRTLNLLPAVDIRETEKAYVLEAELPGFDEKDIEIRLNGNYLTIESKRDEEANNEKAGKSESKESFLIRERRYSSFSRSFKLPDNSDPEGITASFRNGVLSLEVGKKTETQQRVIQISKN